MRKILLALALAGALTACGGTTSDGGGYSPSNEEGSIDLSEQEQLVLLEMSWDEVGYSTQSDICEGWGTFAEDAMLDAFMEGNSVDYDIDLVHDFFDGKCL